MQTTLYFNNGSSDKIYTTNIIESGDGYLVNFAYGRRGNSLKSGRKTKEPVSLKKAKKIYDKLIKSKTAKGYVPDENGSVYSAVDNKHSGINCQLLNPVDEVQMIKLCHDDNYIAQEKFDGVRQTIEKNASDDIRGINRKGLYVGLSQTIINGAEQIDCDNIIIDCEGLGDESAAFDILSLDDRDLTLLPYSKRLAILASLSLDSGAINLVYTASTTDEKLALLKQVKKRNGEGLVFKLLSSTYESGRPSSGGSQLKFKFYETATVVVTHQNNDRRSVGMAVVNSDGDNIAVGNVTIPPNHDIPDISQHVEVRYLYAYPNGGSLYQPTYLGVRTDKDRPDTTLQLKYKPT